MCKFLKVSRKTKEIADPKAGALLKKKLNDKEYQEVLKLVSQRKVLRDGDVPINPFMKVCYRYSKQAVEAFFKDSKLFNSFLAIEPLIRESGH